jgi:hypothetical protein
VPIPRLAPPLAIFVKDVAQKPGAGMLAGILLGFPTVQMIGW